ncbi:MAG: hypothetical protein ABSG88_01130 [Bradyrhizobium sp.]
MNDATRPTDEEIEAAARVLYKDGGFYNWWRWSPNTKSYDEFAKSDPIGMNEFTAIVERMLMAAARTRPGR